MKWGKVVITELVLSDKSEVEDDTAVVVVKKLSWRSDGVSNFSLFSELESSSEVHMSKQTRQQTKPVKKETILGL